MRPLLLKAIFSSDVGHIDVVDMSEVLNDPHPNPTIDTLYRYAEAVGKEIGITRVDPSEPVAAADE